MASSPGNTPPGAPLVQGIQSLNPAYFALVMATGIVSLAAWLLELPAAIAGALFWLNLGQYGLLWGLTLARAALFPKKLGADLLDHKRGVGFFTLVAATCVLGTQALVLEEWRALALGLWLLGIALWLVLTYTIFTSFTVKETKPLLPEGLHGGWLISVVAAQSVSLLGTMLAPSFTSAREPALFFTLTMWLGGGMLYIWIISLIFYRYTFFTLSPADLSPPYWVNMGAMAISVVAGAVLILQADRSPLLSQLLPFLRGLTLLFWATATWWIPMLVILGVWRHGYRRFRLAYDPMYWGAVFPLGMYTVCTFRLAQAIDAPYLLIIPQIFVYIALAAWTITFVAMLISLARRAAPSSR